MYARLAQAVEEVSEQPSAFVFENAAADLRGKGGGGGTQDIDKRAARARLGLKGAKDHGGHPRGLQRTGTHGARFQGDNEFAAGKPPAIAVHADGLANGLDLGVGGGVVVLLALVPDDGAGRAIEAAVAAAGHRVTGGVLASLGTLTPPRLRGRGLGRYAVAVAMDRAALEGLLPFAEVPAGHTAAHHVAIAVGLEAAGTRTVLALD